MAKNKPFGGAEPPAGFAATDLAVMAGLPVLGLLSWVVPERGWDAITRLSAGSYRPMVTSDPAALARVIRRYLGRREVGTTAEAIVIALVREDLTGFLGLLRAYRPGGWRPRIRVPGLEHVRAALGEDRGAILWVSHFVHNALVAKMGFHQAGLAVSHLSHPRHGFSSTRFGMRYLNRVRTAIEDRYLLERVKLGLDSPHAAMRTLEERLRAGGAVSITVRGEARRPLVVPFLEGELAIAAGAPSLAHKTGAVLLPVFPVRESDGTFSVAIEDPLEAPGETREAAVEAAARAYVRRLEPHVLRHPEQWLGWAHL